MIKSTLVPEEYQAFNLTYLNLIEEEAELIKSFEIGKEQALRFYNDIPKDKWQYAYAPDKWTILDTLQHVIDTERIYAYRALCIARGDKTHFPGFDQDVYVAPAQANLRSIPDLLEEYIFVRNSSTKLFKSLTTSGLMAIGTISNGPLSARAAGFVIVGHEKHHMRVITERYL